jgi:hypothetical protein
MVIAVVAMGLLFCGGVSSAGCSPACRTMRCCSSIIWASRGARARIFAYLDPFDEKNALGKGYQLSHSLIASAAASGTGVGSRPASRSGTTCPRRTRFLLAVIGEELAGGRAGGDLRCSSGWCGAASRSRQAIGARTGSSPDWCRRACAVVGVRRSSTGREPRLCRQGPDAAADELRRSAILATAFALAIVLRIDFEAADDAGATVTAPSLIMRAAPCGHVFPASAVADAMRARRRTSSGSATRGMEATLVPKHGIRCGGCASAAARQGPRTTRMLPDLSGARFWQSCDRARARQPTGGAVGMLRGVPA